MYIFPQDNTKEGFIVALEERGYFQGFYPKKNSTCEASKWHLSSIYEKADKQKKHVPNPLVLVLLSELSNQKYLRHQYCFSDTPCIVVVPKK